MDNKQIDYDIEQFWLGLKRSMVNFYNKHNTLINRPLDKWSSYLNNLQSQKKYLEIEKYIIYYLSLYGNDLLRYNAHYDLNILYTNIRRWDKISIKYKIYNITNSKYINVTFLLIDIYMLLVRNNNIDKTIFDELELFIEFNDFRNLISFSIKENYPSIIDKLLKYDNSLFEQVREIMNFDDKIKYPISAKKLFKICNII
jgi:hypothetical protein